MRPHPNDFYNAFIFENLVNQSMLDIDAARIRPDQVSYQLFVTRRGLERINFEDSEKFFSIAFQSGRREFLGIFLSLSGIDKRPLLHQASSGEHFSTGLFKPRRIDSRIFGIDSRYKVSWIAIQSSTETSMPEFFLPTIRMGSCDFSDSARSFVILAFVAVTVFIWSSLVLCESVINIIVCPHRINRIIYTTPRLPDKSAASRRYPISDDQQGWTLHWTE